MNGNRIEMHRNAFKAVRAGLDEMLDNIPLTFAVAYDAVLDEIRDAVKLFFEQNSANGERTTARKAVSKAKLSLQKDFMAHLNVLANDWSTETPCSASYQTVYESDEEEDYNNTELLDIANNNGKDGDYEYNGDGEDS